MMAAPLLIDEFRRKHSWARGATRGTEAAAQQCKRDLQKALDEVDGLMAGFQYSDEVQPDPKHAPFLPPSAFSLPSGSQANEARPRSTTTILTTFNYLPDIPDIDLDDPGPREAVNSAAAPAPVALTPDEHPMQPHWAAIRELLEETELHHGRFQTLTANSQNPILSGLGDTYASAKAIRKRGTILFKDVLDGFRPYTLKDTFAFASLSFAISKLLVRRGRIKEEDVLAGLGTWRDSIADPGERETFNSLAKSMWPEAERHLGVRTTPRGSVGGGFPPSGPPGNDDGGANEFGSLPNGYALQSNPLQSDLSTLYQDVPDQDLDTTCQFTFDVFDLMYHSRETLGFSGCISDHPSGLTETEHPLQPCSLGQTTSTEPSGFLAPVLGPQDTLSVEDTAIAPETTQLQGTAVFLVILAFFKETRDLLHILSGRGLISRPDKQYKAQEEDQKRFHKAAQEAFFKPRCHGRSCPPPEFTALLSLANLFAEWGYLRSIPALKHYLVTVAGAVFQPGDKFDQFVLWVMGDGDACDPALGMSPSLDGNRKRPRPPDEGSSSPNALSPGRRTWRCDVEGCDVSCQSSSGLHKHKQAIHGQSTPRQCPECDYKCVRRDRLRSHFQSQHRGLAPPPWLQNTRRSVRQ